jgi:hypothetical protein
MPNTFLEVYIWGRKLATLVGHLLAYGSSRRENLSHTLFELFSFFLSFFFLVELDFALAKQELYHLRHLRPLVYFALVILEIESHELFA